MQNVYVVQQKVSTETSASVNNILIFGTKLEVYDAVRNPPPHVQGELSIIGTLGEWLKANTQAANFDIDFLIKKIEG